MFKIYIVHPDWWATSTKHPFRKVQSEKERRSYWTGERWGARVKAKTYKLDNARNEVRRLIKKCEVLERGNNPVIEEL